MSRISRYCVIFLLTAISCVQGSYQDEFIAYGQPDEIGDLEGRLIVRGSGASFPNSVYQEAAILYTQSMNDAIVSYTAMGSSKGKCRLKSYFETCNHPFQDNPGTDDLRPIYVDFIGSDSPFDESDYLEYDDIQMYPAIAGAVTPIYNLPSISGLVLTIDLIARIFRGDITSWGNSDIVALNPQHSSTLTNFGNITVVVRADKSGTTQMFKESLSHFDPTFKSQIGTSSRPTWNNVNVVYRELNYGVCSFVATNVGSISYASLGDAFSFGVSKIVLSMNNNTDLLEPSITSVSYAVIENGLEYGNDGSDPTKMTANLFGTQNPKSWPMAGYSYFAIRKMTLRNGASCKNKAATLRFLKWYYESPSVHEIMKSKGFARLPEMVRAVVVDKLEKDYYCDGSEEYSVHVPTFQTCSYSVTSPIFNNAIASFKLKHSGVKIATSMCQENSTVDIGWTTQPNVDRGAVEVLPYLLIGFSAISNIFGPLNPKADIILTGKLLADIYDGSIAYWDDSKIQSINVNTVLPHIPITIVRTNTKIEQKVDQQLSLYKNDFVPREADFTASSQLMQQSYVYDKVGILALTVDYGTISNVLASIHPVSPFDTGDYATVPDSTSLQACVSKELDENDKISIVVHEKREGCYPFKFTTYLEYNLTVRDGICHHQPLKFVNFVEHLINSAEEYGNFALISSTDDAKSSASFFQDKLSELECNGESIAHPPIEMNYIPKGLVSVGYGIVSVFFFICVSTSYWIRKHRKKKLIKLSGRGFMQQVVLGCGISVLTILCFAAQDDVEHVTAKRIRALSIICMIQPFMYSIGFGFTFISLLLKSWRINRILINPNMKRVIIPNRLLLLYEGAVFSILIAINILWIIFDPLYWERTPISYDEFGRVSSSVGHCICNNAFVFIIPIGGFVLACLVYGNYLGYKGRNAPSDFSEGKWVALALGLNLEAYALAIPILIMTSKNPTTSFVVKMMLIFTINVGTWGTIFLPKIMIIWGLSDTTHESLKRDMPKMTRGSRASADNTVVVATGTNKVEPEGITKVQSFNFTGKSISNLQTRSLHLANRKYSIPESK